MFCTPGNSDVPGRPRISLKYIRPRGGWPVAAASAVSRERASESTNERVSSLRRRTLVDSEKASKQERHTRARRGTREKRTSERTSGQPHTVLYGRSSMRRSPVLQLYRGLNPKPFP